MDRFDGVMPLPANTLRQLEDYMAIHRSGKLVQGP